MSIISFVGGAAVFSSASGGKVYAFNNINTSANTTVAPANGTATATVLARVDGARLSSTMCALLNSAVTKITPPTTGWN